VSLDCLLGTSDQGEMKVLYRRLIIAAGLPVALILLTLGFWIVNSKIGLSSLQEVKERSCLTVIVFLFLLHPMLTKIGLLTFNCISMEGESLLAYDPSVKCFDGLHISMAFGVALPILLLYTIGIPFLAAILLYSHRH